MRISPDYDPATNNGSEKGFYSSLPTTKSLVKGFKLQEKIPQDRGKKINRSD
jgi:hypothetical protein